MYTGMYTHSILICIYLITYAKPSAWSAARKNQWELISIPIKHQVTHCSWPPCESPLPACLFVAAGKASELKWSENVVWTKPHDIGLFQTSCWLSSACSAGLSRISQSLWMTVNLCCDLDRTVVSCCKTCKTRLCSWSTWDLLPSQFWRPRRK